MTRVRALLDSPSKQLMQDLVKDLEQVRLHTTELKRVKEYERRSFIEHLDRLDREREQLHNDALSATAAKREQLRREAEETLRQHLQKVEEDRRRAAEEERIIRDNLQRQKVENERREREEAAKRETERAKAEERKRQVEENERLQRAKEEAEKARIERERLEQEKRRQEDAQLRSKKEQEEQRLAQQKKQQSEHTFLGETRRSPEEIAEHRRYLELHKYLKEFRNRMLDETKRTPVLKQQMGDMRRTIKKCVGQLLTDDKVANRTPTNEIVNVLKKAATLQEPSIDIRQMIAFPPPHIANEENKVPALLIYLLNIFSKAIIAQLVAEAGVTPKCAGPLGVLTAQIFSMDAFVYKGCPLIDILLAKFHYVCPVLWGFYGSESTAAGKTALGWWRDEPNGPFVSNQVHEERMIGLGAGFAAISLRDFSKTSRQNPLPNTHFWRALANIVNVPPEEVQDTHLTVLGAMLKFSAQRVVGFWGDIGLLALRNAIVTFPGTLPRKSSARSSVEILGDLYAREHRILV